MVQIRAGQDGIVMQQLLYADEVRSQADLHIEKSELQAAELQLAEQLIEQYRVEGYDPTAFKDEEKERVLAAIDQKIAGKKISSAPAVQSSGAEVIDLLEALRASLQKKSGSSPANSAGSVSTARSQTPRAAGKPKETKEPASVVEAKPRKGVRRATTAEAAPAPARRTASKK